MQFIGSCVWIFRERGWEGKCCFMGCLSIPAPNCWTCCMCSTLAVLTLLLSQSAAGPFCSENQSGLFCFLYCCFVLLILLLEACVPSPNCGPCGNSGTSVYSACCLTQVTIRRNSDHAGPMAYSTMGSWHAVLSVALVTDIFLGFCRDRHWKWFPALWEDRKHQTGILGTLFAMHGFVCPRHRFAH